MPISERPLYAFTTGEVSKFLAAREPWDRYPTGCQYVQNLYGLPQGALTRRPGTRHIAPAKSPDFDDLRLVPFVYNANQAYVLEFGFEYIRFFTDRGVIGAPYEVATPYSSGTVLFELNYVQINDVLYVVSEQYPPKKLVRHANQNWVLEDVQWFDGPWLEENTDADIELITDTATNGSTGKMWAQTSAKVLIPDYFSPLHAPQSPGAWGSKGTYWRLGSITGGLNHDEWTTLPGPIEPSTSEDDSNDIAIGDTCKNDGRVYRADTGSIFGRGDISPIHDEGIVSDGRVDWEFLHDGWGYVEVTNYVSGSEVDIIVRQRIPGSVVGTPAVDEGTRFWQQGAWSDGPGVGDFSDITKLGWPRVIGFYETRLWLAGSTGQPATTWASKTDQIENMSPDEGVELGVFDDNAFQRILLSKKSEVVRWMITAERFFMGTSEGVWTFRASDIDQPMTPENVQARKVLEMQLANRTALRFGHSLFFAARGGRKLFEMTYDSFSETVTTNELTLINDDIMGNGLRDLVFQERDNPQIWFMLNDGGARTMTWNKEENAIGWFRQILAPSAAGPADVIAMTVIPGSSATNDNEHDQVWMAVERTIDGTNAIHIEMVDRRQEDLLAKNMFFLDNGQSQFGPITASTPIFGLDYLEGETVAIWTDGAAYPDQVVTSGAITLTVDVDDVISIGLRNVWQWKSLKPYVLTGNRDPGLGRLKKLFECVLSLWNTGAVKIGMSDADYGHLGGTTSENQKNATPVTLSNKLILDNLTQDVRDAYLLADTATSGAPRPLVTGDFLITFDASFRRNAQVILEGDEPSNFSMVAIVPIRQASERV